MNKTENAALPVWKFSGGEVAGRGHVKKHIPCQDKTKSVYCNDTYVIALADGAGSAKYAHFGAEEVVNGITELLALHFDSMYETTDGRDVKKRIIDALQKNLERKAAAMACLTADLASTVLAVGVNKNRYLIVHVGDGVVGYLQGDDLKVASAPKNGEHSNETYFVTSTDAISNMELYKGEIRDIAGFILMSDGAEQSLYNKQKKSLSKAVVKLMQRNEILSRQSMDEQINATLRNVIAKKTYDDCSVALLTRENALLHSPEQMAFREKVELYLDNRPNRSQLKRVMRYDAMLELLRKPCTCRYVARMVHVKYRYAKNHLSHLVDIGLVKKENGLYVVRR